MKQMKLLYLALFVAFSMPVMQANEDTNEVGEMSTQFGYTGRLGAATWCDSTINTVIDNQTTFPIKVLGVDGGKPFIPTTNKLNRIGTKQIAEGIPGVLDSHTAKTVLAVSNECIDYKGTQTIAFNTRIELPEIGDVLLQESIIYRNGIGYIGDLTITPGKNNSADKAWFGRRKNVSAEMFFSKGKKLYTVIAYQRTSRITLFGSKSWGSAIITFRINYSELE